jgi:uncharacterized protein
MALSRQLISMLICPNCRHEKLDYRESSGRLSCPKCRLAYPVADDIPVLLVDEAENKE